MKLIIPSIQLKPLSPGFQLRTKDLKLKTFLPGLQLRTKDLKLKTNIVLAIVFLGLILISNKGFAQEPGPEYLSETAECRFTPELKELAKELNYDPVKIYQWVYENIADEGGEDVYNLIDYTGSRKGAHCTYLTKAGNRWDICSLLVALFRISGIPSRYVCPTSKIYFSDPEIPPTVSVGYYLPYVEVFVSMENYRGNRRGSTDGKKAWVPLAPWLTRDSWQYEQGIDLFPDKTVPEQLQFNFDEYLTGINQKGALELFEEKINNYLLEHYPGKSLKDVPLKKYRRQKFPILPLEARDYEDGPENYFVTVPVQARVSAVVLFKKADGTVLLEQEIYLAEVAGRRLCLDFVPASQDDANIIANYSGICQTPKAAARIKPVLRLDGTIIKEGIALSTGDYFRPVIVTRPDETSGETQISYQERPLQLAGSFIQIGLDAFSASQETIQNLKSELRSISAGTALNDNSREEYLGRLGQILLTNFLLREAESIQRVNALTHCRSSYNGDMSIFYTFVYCFPSREMKTDDESKFLLHPQWNIDAQAGAEYRVQRIFYKKEQASADLRNTDLNSVIDDLLKEYSQSILTGDHPLNLLRMKLYIYESSYNEGRIFEDWQDTPGASTVKGIMLANEQGISIVTLTKDDIVHGGLPVLENETQDKLSPEVIQTIIAELNDGQTVTLPVREIHYQDLLFWVYMSIGPKRIGMMFNQNHGGASAKEVKKNEDLKKNTGNYGSAAATYTSTQGEINSEEHTVNRTVAGDGDPVDMVNGEFYHEEKPDLAVKSRGIKLELIRKYKSKLIYNGPFGYGWTFNHAERLLIGVAGDIVFYNAESSPYHITFDGSYHYPAGTTFTISKDADGYILTNKDKSKLFFNSQGLLVRKEDSNANILNFDYDDNNQLIKISDSLGRYISFVYNADGKIIQAGDFSGRYCRYDYDNDDLIRFTDVEGNVTGYEYLKNQENYLCDHNLSRYILPNGDYLELGYYKDDTVAFHTNKKNETFNFQYSRLNRYAETWNEQGYYRKIFYNENDDVIRITTREKTVELMEYDAGHNLTKHTDANGYAAIFNYDSQRNLISKKNALGETWHWQYNSFSKPVKITDPNGNVTVMTYDSRGNLTAVTNPLGNATTYVYDDYGNLRTTNDSGGNSEKNIYDSDGLNVINTIDKNGNTIIYGYDSLGNCISVTDPKGNITAYEYNEYNRKTKVIDAYGNITKYEYDSNGRLISQIEPNNAVTRNTYDTTRDLVSGAKIKEKIDPLGNKEIFEYDKLGNLISQTDKNNNTVRFSYDEFNRLVETIFDMEDDHGKTFYYNSENEWVMVRNPYKNIIRNSYDANGNLITVTDKRGNTASYTYDAANRKTGSTDPLGNKTTYQYDANGNLISETNALGIKTRYEYNGLNQLTKKVSGEGLADSRSYNYQYDTLGRLIKEIDPAGNKIIFEYDPNANKTKETFYDTENLELKTQNYIYDCRNLLIGQIDPNGNSTKFEYDALARKTAQSDSLENRTEYVYDETGNLTQVKNALGYVTGFEYNLRKEKITQTDALGNVTTYSYDSDGNLIMTTDSEGNTTEYAYDSLNRKIGQTNALGISTAWEYDENSNIIAEIDALQNMVYYEYDQNNRVITQSFKSDVSENLNDPDKKEVVNYNYYSVFAYDRLGRLKQVTNPRGAFTIYEYNEFNEVIAVTDALGIKIIKEYDSLGRFTKITDAMGVRTVNEYDNLGRIIRIIQAQGLPEQAVTSFEYDKNNNKIKETNALGTVTTFGYDSRNLLIKKTLIADGNLDNIIYQYEYDAKGQLAKAIDPQGNITEFQYDVVGRKVKEIKPVFEEGMFGSAGKQEFLTFSLEYDSRGNLIKETTPAGVETRYEYDEINRKIKTMVGEDSKQYEYDVKNRLIKETDFNGIAATYSYDALDRLTVKIEAKDTVNEAKTVFGYDAADNLVSVDVYSTSYSEGKAAYSFEYDLLNRVTAEIDADKTAKLSEYDPNGNVRKITKRSGMVIRKEYDNLNRLIKVWADGRIEQEFSYDILSRMIRAVDYNSGVKTNTVEFKYDCFNRVIAEIQNGERVEKHYDVNSNLTQLNYPSGKTVEKTYTKLNRLKELYYLGTKISSFTYNKDNRIQTAAFNNGVTQEITYNDKGWEQSRQYSKSGTTLYAMQTNYDKEGNILQETINQNNEQIIKNYTYDNQNRLTRETNTFNGTNTQQYDQLGNITALSHGNYSETRQVNSDNEYTAISDRSIAYNNNGNLVKETKTLDSNLSTFNYIYDWADRLVTAQPNAYLYAEVTYTYDALNRRVWEKRDTNTFYWGNYTTIDFFIYDAQRIIERRDSSSNLTTFVYGDYVDDPLMMETSWSGRYYYLKDRQYSITALTDTSGNIVESYSYTGFGAWEVNKIGDVSPCNPYGFTGRWWDNNAQVWHYRSRAYSPNLMRFLQRDPAGYVDGCNLYAFNRNNPLRYLDAMGLSVNPGQESFGEFVQNTWSGLLNLINPMVHGQDAMPNFQYMTIPQGQLQPFPGNYTPIPEHKPGEGILWGPEIHEGSKNEGILGTPIPEQDTGIIADPIFEQDKNYGILGTPIHEPRITDYILYDDAISVVDDVGIGESRYVYDVNTHNYRDLKTGRFIKQQDLPYPSNSGFETWSKETLQPGMIIDRYGKTSGRYAGQPGTTISQRGMPLGSENLPYTQFEVIKPIENVKVGPAISISEFGAEGGATQYYLPKSIDDLTGECLRVKK